MQFDILTLLVAVALVTGFCALARIVLQRMHPSLPGLGYWAAASVLGAVALLLVASHDRLPDLISLSLAQLLGATGFVLAWQGFRLFTGLPGLSGRVLGLLAAGVLTPLALSQATHSLPLRAALNATMLSLLSALIARDLLRMAGSTLRAQRATGWIYAVNAAFFALRLLAVFQEAEPMALTHSSGFTAFSLLWWLCMSVMVTLGMALMANERLQEDLNRQASHDPLTGVLNRRAFDRETEKRIAAAQGRPLSLLMMDLDHFKQINDQLGHHSGDEVLQLFVAIAERSLRPSDLFCRFGGEEFVALLPDTTTDQALAVAERLRIFYGAAAQADRRTAALPFPATVSIGISAILPGEDLDDGLRRADQALYRAKQHGRNRCETTLLETAPLPL